ncbi:hypothetical protein COW36_08420 [bacterium (Candidatus Blackallbacteria) CG17_big_fil_post_rev_8_21_14_2_50_48_46]|uniref:non-specific serine/threonine protein kinase n=1 Tax=bacterium (Candidatus Blackallbacteria) CG17_big_fil_post_rev_8_21_14_2_50_48_46 TaxID=2014261 RepID=A0A2M7G665_9BACT|nr:MAG: hypothetical protein COW64_24960 [bacterium (Candidatus Blackallbacteria) CG18_big_fil_WC_8_21_14_2_50_49_26]PIW17514.1 MAG: hypothetical protein COW36_08420 [bacterium (Candidatus Blackallbacteria) CG17_big_fil_post_rev_8_21_14_2_50_48_46]PIW48368.1 MAG: hypothetical protein COW20_09775 [bacterium (Candidatus Blackallbacteria) CG13_big_fil_rev_8_21_14_2_50_49_14]
MNLVPNDKLKNRYQIEAVLNPSPLNPTYSAIDIERNEFVVIKELKIEVIDDWKRLELFEREAQTLANLDHIGIPRLIDHFRDETETRLFLVVEKISGISLAQMLNKGWRPTEAAVIQIGRQILSLLDYLHRLNPPVVHRDIKPSNILRSADETISLVDFGAAQYLLHPEGGRTVVGTFGYMAPEQFAGKAEPASDLYSLGATMIHMLSGRSPAEMPQSGHDLQFQEYLACSRHMINWLKIMVDPRLTHRFRSAREALYALEQVAEGKTMRLPEPESLSNTAQAPSKKAMKIGVFALLGVSLLGGLLYLFAPKSPKPEAKPVQHACFGVPLLNLPAEKTAEAESFRKEFSQRFPIPLAWEKVMAPHLSSAEELNTLWRCKSSRNSADAEMFIAARQAVLDFPSKDETVVKGLYYMVFAYDAYAQRIDLERYTLDKYFYFQSSETYDKPAKEIASITTHLAQDLNKKNLYAETIERVQHLLSEREKEINDHQLQTLSRELARAYWKTGNKNKALKLIEHALKAYPEGSWKQSLLDLRKAIEGS